MDIAINETQSSAAPGQGEWSLEKHMESESFLAAVEHTVAFYMDVDKSCRDLTEQESEIMEILRKKEQILDESDRKAFLDSEMSAFAQKHNTKLGPPSVAWLTLGLVKSGQLILPIEEVRRLVRVGLLHNYSLLFAARPLTDEERAAWQNEEH